MQEEVTQKTIALYVKVGKGAARLTEQALQKAIQKFLEQKSKPAHGKQTMRQLMKQNAGVSNIEITDSNIKAFESTAKKYNIDFSLKKVKGEQTRYLVFFKGRDADVMLFTYPVAGAPDKVIALLVGMVLFVVNEANRVENQVIMQMVFIDVSCQNKLILAA